MLARQPFDTVVTDLRMPEMDGMELLAQIGKRWPSAPGVAAVVEGHAVDDLIRAVLGEAELRTESWRTCAAFKRMSAA